MRKIATIILLSASLFAAACNTVKGVGEDIESVGEAGDKAIKKVILCPPLKRYFFYIGSFSAAAAGEPDGDQREFKQYTKRDSQQKLRHHIGRG